MELTVGGLAFSALDDGPVDGEPVLLLHGFPEGASCWSGVLPGLGAAGLRAVAPDQRGYSAGVRPAETAAYGLDQLVDDVLGMLDALGRATVHLVGHDWGAMVAWVLAARRPDRVRTLTVTSIPHPAAYAAALASDPEQQRLSGYLRLFAVPGKAEDVLLADGEARLRQFFDGSGMAPEEVDAFVAPLLVPGALTAALDWYRAVRPADYADVPPVAVPTTYLWGEHDLGVSPAAALGCAAHVDADFRFVPLAQGSHWLPEQLPEVVAAEVVWRVTGGRQSSER
jgi:pimeloyl-ACP methyl ester carboxylesterase